MSDDYELLTVSALRQLIREEIATSHDNLRRIIREEVRAALGPHKTMYQIAADGVSLERVPGTGPIREDEQLTDLDKRVIADWEAKGYMPSRPIREDEQPVGTFNLASIIPDCYKRDDWNDLKPPHLDWSDCEPPRHDPNQDGA